MTLLSAVRIPPRLLLLWLLAVLPLVTVAQGLSKPTGPVVLQVSGKIALTNSGDLAEFDAAMLDALPVSHIATTTPWQKGVVSFAGPSLKTLLNAVGAHGQTLRMVALDDYTVQIPVDDAVQFNPVLSRRMNGVALKVRDRGPLFLIYPFDDRPALKNELYYNRSIWHLARIVVE